MGAYVNFYNWLIRKLWEQRGEAGASEGEFTKEELEILGEDTGEEEEPASGEAGEEEEPGEGEAGEEEEGESGEDAEEEETAVPQSRFDEVYGQAKESQRKLDLLQRLGPDEYYKIYPDEKPKTEGSRGAEKTTITEPVQDRVLSFQESQAMIIDGGEHHGQTLGELYKENPIAAQDIYLNYRDEQRAAIEQKKASAATQKQVIETELNEFSGGIAKQMFEKELDALSDGEAKKVDEVITSVMDWMEKSGRFHYKLEDAFMIMNKDDLLAGAKSDGAKALIKQLKVGSTPSVKANKGSGGKKTGYEAYGSMSRDELAAKVDDMSDAEFVTFSNKAPQSLKDKFGDIPWV
jgi:hypothetical protein